MRLDKSLLDKIANDDANLKTLSFPDSKLSEQDLISLANALKTNTSITELNLSNQPVGDAGIALLADVLKRKANGSLVCLNLSNTGITDKSIELLTPLLGSSGLASLILRNNKISAHGTKLLIQHFNKQRNEITTLDLEGNQIDSDVKALLIGKIRKNRDIFNHFLKMIQSADVEELQSALSMGVVLNQFAADFSPISIRGYTPLMLAVIAGNLIVLEQLLNLNTALDDKCLNEKYYGKTVFDIATHINKPEVLQLLHKIAYQRQLARIKIQAETISQEQSRLVQKLTDKNIEVKVETHNTELQQIQKIKLQEQQQEIKTLTDKVSELQRELKENKVPAQKISDENIQKLFSVIEILRKGQEDLAKQLHDAQKDIKDTVKDETQLATKIIVADIHASVEQLMAHQESLNKQVLIYNKLFNKKVNLLLEKQSAEYKQLNEQTALISEQALNVKKIEEIISRLPSKPKETANHIDKLTTDFSHLSQLSSHVTSKQQQLIQMLEHSHSLLDQLNVAVVENAATQAKTASQQEDIKEEGKRKQKISNETSPKTLDELAKLDLFQRRITTLQTLLAANLETACIMYYSQQAEVAKLHASIVNELQKLDIIVGNIDSAEKAELQKLLHNVMKFEEQLAKIHQPIEQLQESLAKIIQDSEKPLEEQDYTNNLLNFFHNKLGTIQLSPLQLKELASGIGEFLKTGTLPKHTETLEINSLIDESKRQNDIIQKINLCFDNYQEVKDVKEVKEVKEVKDLKESEVKLVEVKAVEVKQIESKQDKEKPVDEIKPRFLDPHINKFYITLKTNLTDFYAEARLVATKKIKPKIEGWTRTTDSLKLAADLLPVPYLSLVVNLIGGVINKFAGGLEVADAQLTDKFFKAEEMQPDQVLSADHIISEVSYLVTKNYQWQISHLTDKGVEQLAICAVKRMLGYVASLYEMDAVSLLRKEIDDMKSDTPAEFAAKNAKLASAKIKFLMRGIVEGNPSNLINTSVSCKTSKDWTAEGLFKRSGLELEDGSRYVIDPPRKLFEIKNAMKSRPKKYGYRLGTLEDKEYYKFNKQIAPAKQASLPITFFASTHSATTAVEGDVIWHEEKTSPAVSTTVKAM